ncbi:MAG: hypothetical protein ACOC3F_03420 [Desulfosudaceae bacterium]
MADHFFCVFLQKNSVASGGSGQKISGPLRASATGTEKKILVGWRFE